MKSTLSLIVLAVAALLPTAVYAQDDDGARGGMKATAIVGEGGFSQDGSRSGGWWGGMAFWQPTHRVGIAVSGRWVDAGPGASGFAADISTELGLLPKSSRKVPYVRLGVGAYRATFDLAGATQLAAMPDFYRRRLGNESTMARRQTFMDPAFIVAAGMDVPLTAHLSVRPDVRDMWVVRGGHGYRMVLVGVQLAWHIEEHPVTPSRESR